jgi:hypothetical protein
LLRPEIDLLLIRDSLKRLNETTYFSASLHEFTNKLIDAIAHVLSNLAAYPPDLIRAFAAQMSIAQRYLEGSTTKDAPYELEFCLKSLLPRWVKRNSLITTALTSGKDFHFFPTDPWGFITTTITGFDVNGYNPLLVLIGVPRLYVHKPLYSIPLYHELGHFVDLANSVTKLSLLLSPATYVFDEAHRMEHFADLFAASYVGRSSVGVLETIAPGAPISRTHPATSDRVALVETFLAGKPHPIIELFQKSLKNLGLPLLSLNFDLPIILNDFNDIRPYVIQSDSQLHGLFDAGWNYLNDVLDKRSAEWSTTLPDDEIERIVNDLVEKTIRNKSIRERWNHGTAP